jgi:hypothetical protein
VKIATTKTSRTIRSFPDRCLPAIVAVGSSLATLPAGALELGELTVQSRLGQPLRASIAYALAPTEQISNVCVTMRPGPSQSGLPGFGAARISVANGVIMLIGETPVREPLVSAHVVVNCPYSANLSREYLLFIDPATSSDTPVYQETVVTQQANPRAEPIVVAPSAVERPVAAVRPEPVVRDIETSTRHHVQRGETLSGIASSIQDRPIGLWPAVNAIFEANPNSFTNNDPNNLKAGSWLSIPSFGGRAASIADVESTVADVAAVDAPVEVYEPSFAAEAAPTEEASLAIESRADLTVPVEAPADPSVADTNDAVVAGVDTSDDSAIVLDDLTNADVTVGELRPGDIILDTELPGPTTSSTSPNVTTAVIATDRASDNSGPPSWLNWLAGSVIAIVFGLVMFRRRLDGQASTDPDAPLATGEALRRFSDTQLTDTDNIEVSEPDYDISDDSPTDQNPILDVDLIMGTGLSDGPNTDISDGFRFAESSDLNDETPIEPAPDVLHVSDDSLTMPTVEHAIPDSEVLPPDTDDDYDMSVIIDATKIQQSYEVTEHDFKAEEVTTEDNTTTTHTLMTEKDADYHVLEQDYEDEMTATQALNLELAHAAAELTMKKDIQDINKTDDETSALPLATVTELEITAEMRARNDEISGPDDTVDNEANTTVDEDTVEIPAESGKAS